jgi:hypothetical protein
MNLPHLGFSIGPNAQMQTPGPPRSPLVIFVTTSSLVRSPDWRRRLVPRVLGPPIRNTPGVPVFVSCPNATRPRHKKDDKITNELKTTRMIFMKRIIYPTHGVWSLIPIAHLRSSVVTMLSQYKDESGRCAKRLNPQGECSMTVTHVLSPFSGLGPGD